MGDEILLTQCVNSGYEGEFGQANGRGYETKYTLPQLGRRGMMMLSPDCPA